MTVAILSKLGSASQVSTLPSVIAAETEGATDRFHAFLASFEHPSALPATAPTSSQTASRPSDNAQDRTVADDARASTSVMTHQLPDAKNACRASLSRSVAESGHSDVSGKTNQAGAAAKSVAANGTKIASHSGSRPTTGQVKGVTTSRQGTKEQPSVSHERRSAFATPLSPAAATGPAAAAVPQNPAPQDAAVPSMPDPTVPPESADQSEVTTIDAVTGGSQPARQAVTVGSGGDPSRAGDVPSADELPNSASLPDVAIDTDVPLPNLDDTTASSTSTPEAPELQDNGEEPVQFEDTTEDAGLTIVHRVVDEQQTTHVTLDLGERGTVQIDVAKDHLGTAVSIRAGAGLAQELGEHRNDMARAVNGVSAAQVIMSQQIQITSIGRVGVSSSLSSGAPSVSLESTDPRGESGYDASEPLAEGPEPSASKPGETRYRRRFVNVFV